MARKAIDSEPVPFSDLPYKELSPLEKEIVRPFIVQLRKVTSTLLGSSIDATFRNGIYLMGAQFADETGYKGAEVVIEKWLPEPRNPKVFPREFSIAIFADKTINRPNSHNFDIIHFDDGSTEIDEQGVNKNYEVPLEELEKVLKDLSECNEQTLMPPSRLSQHLAQKLTISNTQIETS